MSSTLRFLSVLSHGNQYVVDSLSVILHHTLFFVHIEAIVEVGGSYHTNEADSESIVSIRADAICL